MTIKNFPVIITIINFILLLIFLGGFRSFAGEDESFLRIQGLELVDKNGIVRSSLKIESEGEVVLRFFDEKGTIRFKAGASEKGSGLLLLNNSTDPGIQILAKESRTSLKLTAQNGKEKLIEP